MAGQPEQRATGWELPAHHLLWGPRISPWFAGPGALSYCCQVKVIGLEVSERTGEVWGSPSRQASPIPLPSAVLTRIFFVE